MSQAGAGQWHYIDQSGQKGPFSVEQMAALVRAGTVRADTMVWTAGMAGWVPFARSPLAAQAGGAAPPPSPGVALGFDLGPADPNTFVGAIKTCLSKYAAFTGRARRPEFWWFVLFAVLGGAVCNLLDSILFGAPMAGAGMSMSIGMHTASPISSLFNLALLVPGLAVGARRLHDTDRTGWWQLIHFLPLVGQVVLIVLFCQRGTPEPNRFG